MVFCNISKPLFWVAICCKYITWIIYVNTTKFICLSVCLCVSLQNTHFRRSRNFLSKGVSLILACNDTNLIILLFWWFSAFSTIQVFGTNQPWNTLLWASLLLIIGEATPPHLLPLLPSPSDNPPSHFLFCWIKKWTPRKALKTPPQHHFFLDPSKFLILKP